MTGIVSVIWALSVLFSLSQEEFLPGRVQGGPFEYSHINGRMITSDARLLCEADIQCGGFTFRGTLSPRLKYDIYFFHVVTGVTVDDTWDLEWMSYKVSRKFLVFRGSFIRSYPRQNWRQVFNTSINMHQFGQTRGEYDALIQYCDGLDVCMAISQHKQLVSEVVVFDALSFLDYTDDPDWMTVISLDAEENQLEDEEWNVNLCCPETPPGTRFEYSVRQQIDRIPCTISAEKFRNDYIRMRKPAVLEGCMDPSMFTTNPKDPNWLTFNKMNYDDILHVVWYGTNSSTVQRSRPKLRRKLVSSMRNAVYDGDKIALTYQMVKKMYKASLTTKEDEVISPSFTHGTTPNNDIEMRANRDLRIFLKASSMHIKLDCYKKYRQKGSDLFKDGYESCLLLDGLWKPPPLPSDLYELTQYNNDIAWIIMSPMTSGSQIHEDPDLMGAWNALLLGRKWWVVFPYPIPSEDLTCSDKCSPGSDDRGHVWPWFKHVLPQLRDKKYYGKSLMEFVQEPGQVLYLPYQMPHTIFNIDDSVAVTENYLFADALPSIMTAMALDIITPYVKWNEERAFRTFYYKYASKEDRERMRGMYDQITELIRRFPAICEQIKLQYVNRLKMSF